MPSISKLGMAIARSGMFGCERDEQGIVFALQCIVEKKPPLEMAKTYHVIGGKLSKRADAMLADFRTAGGKWKWADLKDEKRQSAKIEWEGEAYDVEYTIKQAEAAGLVKEGSAWKKTPAAMLRARCVSETLRAIAPELVMGVYVPEELPEQVPPQQGEPKPVNPEKAATTVAKLSQPSPSDDPFVEAEAEDVDESASQTEQSEDNPEDYSICPIGKNAGTPWMELPRETLEKVIENPRTLSAGHIRAVKYALENTPF